MILGFHLLRIFCFQHAVVFVNGDQYFGAKASINVWAPHVADQYEFSLSQIWIISGSFGNDLNTIEAGWQACIYTPWSPIEGLPVVFTLLSNWVHILQVSPELYGDDYPRFFTYWTVSFKFFYSILLETFATQLNNKDYFSYFIDRRIPGHWLLQLTLLRFCSNKQQDRYWCCDLSKIILQWQTIWYWVDGLEGEFLSVSVTRKWLEGVNY